MSNFLFFAIIIVTAGAWSSLLFLFLHFKTKIHLRFLYSDNLAITAISSIIIIVLTGIISINHFLILGIILPIMVTITTFLLTMLRFWRTPKRKIRAGSNQVVSPADGNIIYIKKIERGEIPISVKGRIYSKLDELSNNQLLDESCWQIGINMTPFDVHKNCAPISGIVTLNQHFKGKFLSLKDKKSLTENERNTYVIRNGDIRVGIIQIASRMVRRIDSYVIHGQFVKQGEWIGMIRFGSQVDLILPVNCHIRIDIKDQVYAGETIVADLI
jgi:phosphatidylserine decarboxylase